MRVKIFLFYISKVISGEPELIQVLAPPLPPEVLEIDKICKSVERENYIILVLQCQKDLMGFVSGRSVPVAPVNTNSMHYVFFKGTVKEK